MSSEFSIQPPPPPRWYRWLVLVLVSVAMFGNYYIYDSISPLADVLTRQLGYTDSDIGLLNAIYSIPNIFMVLIGGIIIDRIGTRHSTVLFAFLCLVGSLITMSSPSLAVMASGRLVFGLGAESLIVAVTTAIAKWFRGKELSFAFGVNLTLARLGSFAALNSPTWAATAYQRWQAPLGIASIFGVICLAGALLYWLLETRGARHYALGASGETDKVNLRQLLSFGRSYWYIVALCVTFYSAIFPFQTFAVLLFQEVHHVSRAAGGGLSSMLTLFAMFATPLFGLLADKVGKRATLMVWGSILLLPVYLVMAYVQMPPTGPDFTLSLGAFEIATLPRSLLILPMAVMGVAFSLIPAVMWPSVAYIVGQERLGTAYGLMTLVQNIGLAGFNLLIGWANDYSGASAANPGGYTLMMYLFTLLGVSALVFSRLLLRQERGPAAHGLETIRAGTNEH